MNSCRNRHPKGFVAVLALLVVVAIGLVIYFMYANTIFKPTGSLNKIYGDSKSVKPWLEEDRIAADGEIVDMPRSPKPLIREVKEFSLPVNRNGKPRGEIELTFHDNGRISGMWKSQFEESSQTRSYIGGFDGNVDTEKTFRRKDFVRESYLYFIAKGPYTNVLRDEKNRMISQEQGTMYVTGYLTPDYTFQAGTITLTTDKSWSAHYQF